MTDDGWKRLHPLSPVVRSGRLVVALVVLAALRSTNGGGSATQNLIDLGALALGVVGSVVAWLVTRWRLDSSTLFIETGLIRRGGSRRLPLARLQAVDVVQPFLAKVFGLAEVRIRLAGSSRVDGRLGYLSETEASTLRERLLTGQRQSEPEREPPANAQLAAVTGGRLIASILLSGSGATSALILIALVAISVAGPHGFGASAFGWFFVVALNLWRRVRSEYGFTISHVPEGLRIQSGLLQTVTETIPRARIQSIRRVEPLLWRPFGWVRLEIVVASKQADTRGGRQARRVTRALLPVGTAREAEELLVALLPRGFPQLALPPKRSMLRAPFSYHFLGGGADANYAVGSLGRVCRKVTIAPLEKAQSIRQVQGPLERRLGLASIYVDVAGRRAGVKMSSRGVTEANQLIERLTIDARAARILLSPREAQRDASRVEVSGR